MGSDRASKLKVGVILLDAAHVQSANGSARANTMVDVEAGNRVARFGALGTFLANFQNEDIRYRYTMLTWELAKIVKTRGRCRRPLPRTWSTEHRALPTSCSRRPMNFLPA
jgi:hypothetical protein